MVIDGNAFVMLIKQERFRGFIALPWRMAAGPEAFEEKS